MDLIERATIMHYHRHRIAQFGPRPQALGWKAPHSQWDRFEQTGIWSSDCYHHDGSDSWSAIRYMNDAGVPHAVQANMLGANARRMYGIEGKVFVREEPAALERPAWFPNGEELQRWAAVEANPRAHGVSQSIDFSKLDPRMIMSAIRSY